MVKYYVVDYKKITRKDKLQAVYIFMLRPKKQYCMFHKSLAITFLILYTHLYLSIDSMLKKYPLLTQKKSECIYP